MKKNIFLFLVFLISFKALASTNSLSDNFLGSRDHESLNLDANERFSLSILDKEIKSFPIRLNEWNKFKRKDRTGSVVSTSVLSLVFGLSVLGDWYWCNEANFSEAGCTASLVSSVVSLSCLIGSSVWISCAFSHSDRDNQRFLFELSERKNLIVDSYRYVSDSNSSSVTTLKKYYDLFAKKKSALNPTMLEVAQRICLANRTWMFIDTKYLDESLEASYKKLGIFNISRTPLDEILSKIFPNNENILSEDQIQSFDALNKDTILEI